MESHTTISDIDSYQCPICLNLLIEPVKISCGHIFCKICLDQLYDNLGEQLKFKCPMCRTTILKLKKFKIKKKLEMKIKENFPEEYNIRAKVVEEYKKTLENLVEVNIMYGNTHELIGSGDNKHKWSAFVKIGNEDNSKYFSKVIFGLHPTFRVNQVEVTNAPFMISRIGWGIFEIPIKVYFHEKFQIKEPLELSHVLSFRGSGICRIKSLKIDKSLLN